MYLENIEIREDPMDCHGLDGVLLIDGAADFHSS